MTPKPLIQPSPPYTGNPDQPQPKIIPNPPAQVGVPPRSQR